MHRFILCQNYMMFRLVLYPLPHLRQCIVALSAFAEGWLLLDIGRLVLFLLKTDLMFNLCFTDYDNFRSLFFRCAQPPKFTGRELLSLSLDDLGCNMTV